MCNTKRSMTVLLILTILCGMFVGCSRVENNPNSSLTKQKSTSTVATTDHARGKNDELPNNPGNNENILDSSTLESWIGDYTFSEFSPPDQNMFYSITIYKEDSNYKAKIIIFGFQTLTKLQAKVSGDENSIKLIFEKYLPDNVFELYKEGDILLSFEKKNSKLNTFWGKIQPMLESNSKTGKVYFKIKP